jgi:hypothetical protein
MYRAATHKIAQLALAAILAVPVFTVAAQAAGAHRLADAQGGNRQIHRYDFAKSVEPWKGGAYYNPIMDKPEWRPEVLNRQSDGKESFAALTTYGADLVWMQASYKANASLLHLRFDVADAGNAGRLAPIIYVGKEAPTSIVGFEKIGYPLEKGRQTLNLQVDLAEHGLVGGEFVVAIGYRNLDLIQEKQIAAVDNVVVVIDDGE